MILMPKLGSDYSSETQVLKALDAGIKFKCLNWRKLVAKKDLPDNADVLIRFNQLKDYMILRINK